jgi:hypothetical protein
MGGRTGADRLCPLPPTLLFCGGLGAAARPRRAFIGDQNALETLENLYFYP